MIGTQNAEHSFPTSVEEGLQGPSRNHVAPNGQEVHA
jgi:hypothetical protein